MMLNSQTSVLAELEDAIARGSSEHRVDTLRRITDLFLRDAEAFDENQVDLFDDVISRLADQIEVKAREELAGRLAGVANAPIDVITSLAKDEAIEVAGPVLANSPRINEALLVEIASTRGQDHLMAISQRSEITTAVTDVLVNRGDQLVVRSIASNAGAQFSETGMDKLVERSQGDEMLALAVGARADIKPEQFRKLVALATEKVQARLVASEGLLQRRNITDVLGRISRGVAESSGVAARDYQPAQLEIDGLVALGQLTEQQLFGYARQAKALEAVACLAAMCKIPTKAVDRLLSAESGDPILILAKACGLQWVTVRELVTCLSAKLGLTFGSHEAMQANYTKLSAPTAQRVLRFWAVRESAAKAS